MLVVRGQAGVATIVACNSSNASCLSIQNQSTVWVGWGCFDGAYNLTCDGTLSDSLLPSILRRSLSPTRFKISRSRSYTTKDTALEAFADRCYLARVP